MTGRQLTLVAGSPGIGPVGPEGTDTLYQLRVSGPDQEGEILLGGTRRMEGGAPEPMAELRAHVAAANGELRLTGPEGTERVTLLRQGRGVWVGWRGRVFYVEPETAPGRGGRPVPAASRDDLRAPMTGVLSEVRVTPGTSVRRDEVVAVMEAMKMEYRLRAPRDGVIAEVAARPEDRVELGAIIVRLRPEAAVTETTG